MNEIESDAQALAAIRKLLRMQEDGLPGVVVLAVTEVIGNRDRARKELAATVAMHEESGEVARLRVDLDNSRRHVEDLIRATLDDLKARYSDPNGEIVEVREVSATREALWVAEEIENDRGLGMLVRSIRHYRVAGTPRAES